MKPDPISNEQADRMLALVKRRDWDYGASYLRFYQFIQSLAPDERENIIKAIHDIVPNRIRDHE